MMSSTPFQQQLDEQLRSLSASSAASLSQPIVSLPPRVRTATQVRANPRQRALMAAAAATLLMIPIMILAIRSYGSGSEGPSIPAPINGLAQLSGTPVPCSVVQPSTLEISGTPVNKAILLANANRPYPNVPGYSGPVMFQTDLPAGPPASPEDLSAIQRTLTMFATCLYERHFEGLDALFSDDTFRRTGSSRNETPLPMVTPNPTLAWIPTPVRPLDSRSAPVTPVIMRSNILPDGRVGVLLEEDIAGYGLQQYLILVQSERGWLIDEEVMVTTETRPSPEASSLTVAITAIDLQFQPSRVEITADIDFTLVITNAGQVRKTFVIPELGIDEELPVGETISVHIIAPKGVYEFYSDVPGQKAAGMQGLLIVIP